MFFFYLFHHSSPASELLSSFFPFQAKLVSSKCLYVVTPTAVTPSFLRPHLEVSVSINSTYFLSPASTKNLSLTSILPDSSGAAVRLPAPKD